MMSKISRLIGLSSATEQLGVLLPMGILSLQQKDSVANRLMQLQLSKPV